MSALQPYPAYKDSGVEWLGDVPEHWEVRRLRTLSRGPIANGIGASAQSWRADWPRYIRITDIAGPRTLRASTKAALPPGVARSVLLEPGDVLFAAVGATYGKSYLYDGACGPACFAGYLVRLTPNNHLLSEFLSYWSESTGFWDQVHRRVIKATIENFSAARYKRLVCPLPPLPEQTAIARFLDDADRRIRRYIRAKERLIELLEEEGRATIHEVVTGRIDVRTGQPYPAYKESGVEWLGRVPEHWEVRRNVWLFRERNETGLGSLPVLEVSIREGVRIRDMDNGQRKQQILDRSQYKRAHEGDVAYNTMRMWQGAVGVVPEDGLVSPAYVVANPVGCTEPRYYGYLFRTRAYQHATKLFSRGIVSDRDRLYWDDFKRLASPVPPPSEETGIVEFLDHAARSIRAAISATQRQIDLLREYRTRLIADVVTGKLDVREAAVELPETAPLATDRARPDTIPTESNPHSTERDMMKEAIP